MKRSEKKAKEELKKRDVHTDKRGSSGTMNRDGWESHTTRSTSLQNLRDAINTFRQGR